jgi:hypothetical protein
VRVEKRLHVLGSALLLGCAQLAVTPAVDARITHIQVVSVQSPTFGGLSFGDVGQYEKIFAIAYGEVDPADARNALITDIQLAPRNASGKVEYNVDVHIIKPIDMSKGNGRILYDVVNRGNDILLGVMNGAGGNNPTTAADAGTGLMMRLGYTHVVSGWEDEGLVAPGNSRALARLPIARNPDGSSVVANTITEQIFDAPTGTTFPLTYAAANLDKSQAYMLVHNHTSFVGGPLVNRVLVPSSVWSYVDNLTVQINRTDPFLAPYDQGAAFEFVYPAKDPQVLGLGFAATRDVVSYLRHSNAADNPLRGGIQFAITHGESESGRYLKGFTYWGFNQDEDGNIVFEGIQPKISGAHAIASNDRFGDANATGRSYQRHLSAKQEFPFTYEVRTDPIGGKTDGIFVRCQATNTCPKVAHTDSGNEPRLKPTNLVTQDGLGRDIVLPDNVRVYDIGSTQHAPQANVSTAPSGVCQQPGNPNPHSPYVRALLVELDQWATQGIPPPPSKYARANDGTLVTSLPQSSSGFPVIPGVVYTGWYNPVDLLDKSTLPPTPIPGKSYTVLVPKADADGNDLPGIRTAQVQVPVATYTGWALRRAPFAANEDCALTGQFIPFAKTLAARTATGDPRPSLAERYPTFDTYDGQLITAINNVIQERSLLCEDGTRELARLRQLGAAQGVPNPPATFAPHSFALDNLTVASSQPVMWPPNGKMVSQNFTATAPNTCSASCAIVQVSGSDGATSADWQITGPMTATLRADRSGKGNGRTYTVAMQCTDPSTSLSAMKTVAVTVPHDQGKN